MFNLGGIELEENPFFEIDGLLVKKKNKCPRCRHKNKAVQKFELL